LQSQLNCFGFENKKGNDSWHNFIHSDPGHAKSDKPRENEAKKEYSETEVWQKSILSNNSDINSIA
jgi:IS5 family transposase